MKSKALKSILVILVFIFSFYGRQYFIHLLGIEKYTSAGMTIGMRAWYLIPPLVLLAFLFKKQSKLDLLGLKQNPLKAFVVALIITLPMLLSSSIIGSLKEDMHWLKFLHYVVFAGFFEEFLFRGFLFGILFRKLSWGFIPAAIVASLVFGLGHLYQSEEFYKALGIFLVTFVGSAWFAWLYIEFDNNLWLPIFLHILMNMSWYIFSLAGNALGDITPNIFRFISIALSVIYIIRYRKKLGFFNINRSNLIISKSN